MPDPEGFLDDGDDLAGARRRAALRSGEIVGRRFGLTLWARFASRPQPQDEESEEARARQHGEAERPSQRASPQRARVIALAIAVHIAFGGSVMFDTFTMSHQRGEKLDFLWQILSDGWAALTSGRPWTEFKASFGLIGMIHSAEVTQGASGWHPHLHVLFPIDRPMNDFDWADDYRYFGWHLRNRWITWFAEKQQRNVAQECSFCWL